MNGTAISASPKTIAKIITIFEEVP